MERDAITYYLIFADHTAKGVNAKDEADAMAQAEAMGIADAVIRVDRAMSEAEFDAPLCTIHTVYTRNDFEAAQRDVRNFGRYEVLDVAKTCYAAALRYVNTDAHFSGYSSVTRRERLCYLSAEGYTRRSTALYAAAFATI